jgi:hypothetical protein
MRATRSPLAAIDVRAGWANAPLGLDTADDGACVDRARTGEVGILL